MTTSNNNNTMSSLPALKEPAHLPEAVQLGFLLARCAVSVAILVGSSLTVAAVARYKRLRTCPNRVVVSLAAADLMGGLLCPALLGLYYLPASHPLWRPMCLLEEALDLTASAGNVLSILLIALDRFLHVVKFYQHIVTRRRVTIGLLCVWVYVVVVAAGIVAFGNDLGGRRRGKGGGPAATASAATAEGGAEWSGTGRRTCSWMAFTTRPVYFYIVLPHVGVVSAAVVLLYARIACFVSTQRRRAVLSDRKRRPANQGPTAALPSGGTRRNPRTNSMIAIVVCAYFAATLPTLVVSAYLIDRGPSLTLLVLRQAAVLWWYMVAAANPFIYVWRNPDFRWAFQRLLCISGGEEKDVYDTDVSSTRVTAAAMTITTKTTATATLRK